MAKERSTREQVSQAASADRGLATMTAEIEVLARDDADRGPVPEAEATRGTRIVSRLQQRLSPTQEDAAEEPAGAHRAFRIALVISGVRCIVSYVLIPFLVPVVSFAGMLSAPVGILLCLVGILNGALSIRRFWAADHPRKWFYTVFMVLVIMVLLVAITTESARLAAGL